MPLLPSPAIPSDPSPQMKAALKYARALSEADFDTLESVTTEDYIHYIHPETLGFPHLEGRDTFIDHFKNILPLFDIYDISVKELIEAPGKVVFHSAGEGITKTGIEYKNEYVGVLYTVEQPDGSYKISAAKEFSDSKFTEGFMAQLQGVVPVV